MNIDDIIQMTREAGIYDLIADGVVQWHEIVHLVNLVAQYEREQCAKVCEQQDEQNTQYRYDYRRGVLDCADAIRSRNNK